MVVAVAEAVAVGVAVPVTVQGGGAGVSTRRDARMAGARAVRRHAPSSAHAVSHLSRKSASSRTV